MWKLPRGSDTPEASRSARQTEGTMLCDFWEQKEKEKRKPALELTLILHVFFWGGIWFRQWRADRKFGQDYIAPSCSKNVTKK